MRSVLDGRQEFSWMLRDCASLAVEECGEDEVNIHLRECSRKGLPWIAKAGATKDSRTWRLPKLDIPPVNQLTTPGHAIDQALPTTDSIAEQN